MLRILARRLFALLKTGAGTMAVGGPKMLIPKCPMLQPFAKLPLQQREAILQYWASSPIPLLKKVSSSSPDDRASALSYSLLFNRQKVCFRCTQAFKGLKSIIVSTIFNASDEKGRNPLWPGIMYEGVLMTELCRHDTSVLLQNL